MKITGLLPPPRHDVSLVLIKAHLDVLSCLVLVEVSLIPRCGMDVLSPFTFHLPFFFCAGLPLLRRPPPPIISLPRAQSRLTHIFFFALLLCTAFCVMTDTAPKFSCPHSRSSQLLSVLSSESFSPHVDVCSLTSAFYLLRFPIFESLDGRIGSAIKSSGSSP